MIKSSLRRFGDDKVKEHYLKTVYRVFQIIISIIALIVILGVWGVRLTGLLAGAGFMGIVIGFAAQETLGNIISGFLMMFSRPFDLWDWIEISEFSGIVKDISIIHTQIQTFDGEEVSIPNKVVSSSAINNISRRGKLRVKKTIGIDYESDPEKAKEIAEEEMKNHEHTANNPPPKAMVIELGDSSVNLELLFWIKNPTPKKRRQALHDLITSIKQRFEENDIGIPFPHRELIQHEDRGWSFQEE